MQRESSVPHAEREDYELLPAGDPTRMIFGVRRQSASGGGAFDSTGDLQNYPVSLTAASRSACRRAPNFQVTMKKDLRRRVALCMTGASGAIYGLRTLEALVRDQSLEVHLSISPSAQKVLEVEHGLDLDLQHFKPKALRVPLAERAVYHAYDDLAAATASGSFRIQAMAIVPCSMGCAGAIAHGVSDDLIQRSADVMIKERRTLVIVPRETPLSAIHLENLLALAKLGVVVLPASPGFYGKPQKVSQLVDFVVARILDHLKVEHELGPRWGERNK